MRSIKPGRGPSFMKGVGSVFSAAFGVIWTYAVKSMHAPFYFELFGIAFIIIGVIQAVYYFKNASGKERFSDFDITNENEEPDPLNESFGQENQTGQSNNTEKAGRFCPYCGAQVKPDYEFCKECGKKL